MELLIIFLAGFASVFALGFQSRAVNHGNYALAAGNSIFIGVAQSNIWGLIVTDSSFIASLVYGLSGAFGIVASMKVHQRFFTKKPPK